jgi:hypothetical protein
MEKNNFLSISRGTDKRGNYCDVSGMTAKRISWEKREK